MAMELNGMRVAIVATHGVEQIELTEPRKALEDAGASTELIAPEAGMIKAWDRTDWGDEIEVDRTIADASPDDYDALLLPGGVLNPDKLRMNDEVLTFVRSFFNDRKPVAAICHGPQVLIDADVVRGRRMTSYRSVRKDLENAGAEWVDQAVVVDDGLITSRNPGDIPDFSEAIVHEFAKARESVGA